MLNAAAFFASLERELAAALETVVWDSAVVSDRLAIRVARNCSNTLLEIAEQSSWGALLERADVGSVQPHGHENLLTADTSSGDHFTSSSLLAGQLSTHAGRGDIEALHAVDYDAATTQAAVELHDRVVEVSSRMSPSRDDMEVGALLRNELSDLHMRGLQDALVAQAMESEATAYNLVVRATDHAREAIVLGRRRLSLSSEMVDLPYLGICSRGQAYVLSKEVIEAAAVRESIGDLEHRRTPPARLLRYVISLVVAITEVAVLGRSLFAGSGTTLANLTALLGLGLVLFIFINQMSSNVGYAIREYREAVMMNAELGLPGRIDAIWKRDGWDVPAESDDSRLVLLPHLQQRTRRRVVVLWTALAVFSAMSGAATFFAIMGSPVASILPTATRVVLAILFSIYIASLPALLCIYESRGNVLAELLASTKSLNADTARRAEELAAVASEHLAQAEALARDAAERLREADASITAELERSERVWEKYRILAYASTDYRAPPWSEKNLMDRRERTRVNEALDRLHNLTCEARELTNAPVELTASDPLPNPWRVFDSRRSRPAAPAA